MNIIHYCCGSYDGGDYGGVARYDYHIKLIFPNRKFFKGPAQKNKMIDYIKSCDNPIIITDNHLANDIPNEFPCILVHHGSALTHAQRDPLWKGYFKNICTNGQKKMLNYRSPNNTIIISISTFCSTEFLKFFPKKYPLFNRKLIFHTSELNEGKTRKLFHKKPIILGNWKTDNKGKNVVNFIRKQGKFNFRQLNVSIKNGNIKRFNNRKQQIYCECDMFLQLSKCEGNSYATLDALLCGLVVVSTNVGLFFKDVPSNCFVKIPWKKINNINFIQNRINFAWKNRRQLAINARKWYLENCSFSQWKNNMINTITDFYNEQYTNNEVNNTI